MTESRELATVDPKVFVAFDRLDDEQIVAEMKGACLDTYVYEFTQDGKAVRGLSKKGTDDASRHMAVKYGEVLRELDVTLEYQDEDFAYFKATVARFALGADGREVELDRVIGQKRQPKKFPNGRVNPFWYEQGGQKALRNAKQKCIPEPIKQAIIKEYMDAGKVRRVTREDVEPPAADVESARQQRPHATPSPTAAQRPKGAAAPERQALMQEWGRLWNEATIDLKIKPTVTVSTSAPIEELREAVEELRAEVEAARALRQEGRLV